jgi:hypothetical protein
VTTLRKNIAIGVGLVSVVLAIVTPPLVSLTVRPYEPPLRAGMSLEEAFQVPGIWFDLMIPEYHGYDYYWCDYESEPDWLGNRYRVDVRIATNWRTGRREDNGPLRKYWTVNSWKVKPLPHTRPPWLDRAIKAVRW